MQLSQIPKVAATFDEVNLVPSAGLVPVPCGRSPSVTSDTRDLVALMDAFGHRRFAVVGHDTGFAIGYALAADHPDRVDKLPEQLIAGREGVYFGVVIPGAGHWVAEEAPEEMTEALTAFLAAYREGSDVVDGTRTAVFA